MELWINSWHGRELRCCGASKRQSRGFHGCFAGESGKRNGTKGHVSPRWTLDALFHPSLFSVSLSRESFERCGGPSGDSIPLLFAVAVASWLLLVMWLLYCPKRGPTSQVVCGQRSNTAT